MLRQYYATTLEHGLLSQPGILAVISHQLPCRANAGGLIPIGLQSLNQHCYEIIQYADQVALRGVDDDCLWSSIDDVMCVATWLSPEECEQNIRGATEKAYQRLLLQVADAGFYYPFRIWNFLPNINLGHGDLEQYKQFCIGRQQAFTSSALTSEQFPAASALGHHCRGGVIYMLASKHPARHFENPRQQPAYRYPRRYGPASPSFARATWPQLQHGGPIMLSGTASILGHNTQAAGNLHQQLELTWSNIEHLQQSIDRKASTFDAVRVYLRNTADVDVSREFLRQYIEEKCLNFVHADICRANLLVEIEAVARVPSES